MTKDETLKLALEALESADWYIKEALEQPEQKEKFCDSNCVWTDHHPDCNLAQPAQEPVAWMKSNDTEWSISFFEEDGYVPLYTSPPQSTWVGLTDEQRINISYKADGNECVAVELTEAKLKELNHG